MRVAIIGAGLSGLSCAFELNKYDIIPTIFEQSSHIGDDLCTACINLRLFDRWFSDPFKKLSELYGLNLKPISSIRSIEIKAPTKSLNVRGNHGYIMKRGIDPDSIENQLAALIEAQVQCGKAVNFNETRNDFDYVVVATGNNTMAKELGVWVNTFTAQARYATVDGDFKTDKAIVWFNTKYAKSGFCYLIPKTSKQAVIVLIVNGINRSELDYYWKEFIITEKIEYPILESKDTEHSCGFLKQYHVGNVYFVGNTAGLTDDFIGIGAVNAIESGIFAARSIVKRLNYKRQLKPINDNVRKLHEYRIAINSLNNTNLDTVLSIIDVPGLKQLVYNNPLFRFSHASPFIKVYNKLK